MFCEGVLGNDQHLSRKGMCCCGGYAVRCQDLRRKYRKDADEVPGPIGRCCAAKSMFDALVVILTNLAVVLVFFKTWMSGGMTLIAGQIAPMSALGYCRCRDLGKSLTSVAVNAAFEDDILNSQGIGGPNQAQRGASTEQYFYDNFTYDHLCVGDKATSYA